MGSNPALVRKAAPSFFPFSGEFELIRRLLILSALFALELAAITLSIDNQQATEYGGLIGVCARWGPLILRGLIVFFTVFLAFACIRFSSGLKELSAGLRGIPIHRASAAAHVASMALFGVLAAVLYRGPSNGGWLTNAITVTWLAAGLGGIAFGATAIIPARAWVEIGRSTGYLWLLAIGAALVAGFGGNAMRELWPRATGITFSLVLVLLKPFANFTGDPATATLGTSTFSETIAPTCSGLEGVGLILSFTTAWLVLFRRECRFPQALILLPAGALILFFLNSVRIAALMLIGNAGYVSIAENGFHSQAGWMAFNGVALGICMAARKVRWISVRPPAAAAVQAQAQATNPTAPWVLPFVAILASGMASRAMTGGFEWTYGLRFFAALAVLWTFRSVYRQIDWRMDWMGPAAGLAVGVIWLALDHSGAQPMPAALATASDGARIAWLALRVIAATVTVPLAEELAFRGFLLRRFLSAEFETVPFRQFSWLSFVASSVMFGLLHGQRWIAGSIAGALFAIVVQRRGRFGNAVVAHGVANAILAVMVLGVHHWDLW